MDKITEVRALFLGSVQGVGFRATVRHLARQLDVRGTVRNCSDGSVEMFAQADKATLEQLMQHIKAEFGSYIKEIKLDYRETFHAMDDFQIIR